MKILHIIESLDIGGAQRLLSDLLPLMAKENNVALLVWRDVDNDFTRKVKAAGVRVIRTGCRSLRSPWNIIRIVQVSKEYDIVHVHLFPMLYWAAFASFLTPIKLVYTEHNTTNRRRGRWYLSFIERMVYSRYKKIISISEKTQEALTGWLEEKNDTQRFIIIYNGVNLRAFTNLKRQKKSPTTLIMVSRFVPSKDQPTLIRAMKLLPMNLQLVLVGDGETLGSCRKLVEELYLSERVHFVGRQENIASWMAKADIGIQSSVWEGFGLTAVEMMASGLPVIASDVDGLKQVVEGGGLLFEAGNEEDLAKQVRLLLNDETFYHKVAERCERRSKDFDINTMSEKYCMIYNLLLNE